MEKAGLVPGSQVAIFGDGPIGLLLLQVRGFGERERRRRRREEGKQESGKKRRDEDGKYMIVSMHKREKDRNFSFPLALLNYWFENRRK